MRYKLNQSTLRSRSVLDSMAHGIRLLVQLLALGFQIYTNEGFERSQAVAIVNENCTRYITTQFERMYCTQCTQI